MHRPTVQEFVKWVIISATIALMSGCGTPKHTTQVVHDTSVDTVYLNSQQYDSIYIYQDRLRDYKRANPSALTSHPSPDTVFLKDVSIEYRYKILRDTVLKVQRDSIPYEVTIVETKEITRSLTWFDHLTRFSFWFLIGSLLTWLILKIKRLKL